MNKLLFSLILLFTLSVQHLQALTTVSGELKKWHRVTLLVEGVNTNENATPNPFRDYRLMVTFHHPGSGKTYTVFGHYAADGNAAEASTTAGNKWRAYFSPDESGTWNYTVSFRTGSWINISSDPTEGAAVSPPNGDAGSFIIAPTDKFGRDHRGKGRLQYVGEHHFQFAETGEYYLKGGADSPENFLAYWEFDGTYDISSPPHPVELIDGLHRYAPHVADWQPGDPSWKSGKGKGIIGALNYLSSKGINSSYFLTYNIDTGDGEDVWMWTSDTERERYDVSKLDQWEIVFSHMDAKGILLHVVTQERENMAALGNSTNVTNNNIRKLYYRELTSRFAHHLAVVWNVGEEHSAGINSKVGIAQYIREADPYNHPITVHTWMDGGLGFYQPILDSASRIQFYELTSLQGNFLQNGVSNFNVWAKEIRDYSASKGKKWVVCADESALSLTKNMSNLPSHRKHTLWANLMGGGGGMEWYFGYQGDFGDLTTEDFRIAEPAWDQTRYALDFFQTYLPFHAMEPDNSLFTAGGGGFSLYKDSEIYAVYLLTGGDGNNASVELSGTDEYHIKWYNPRTGGALQDGTVTSVTANGGMVNIGRNPASDSNDWVALITSVNYTIPTPTTTTWTGNIDSDWFNPANWTNGTPDQTLDAIIPVVTPNAYPLITGAPITQASVKNLTIQSNAEVTIADAGIAELTVYGSLNSNGVIHGAGILTFNGSNTSLNAPLEFSGVIEVTAGSNLYTNNQLILEDGAALMHGAGTLGGGGNVFGNVTMKRNAHANPISYSYWSSPVSGSNVNVIGGNKYYYNPMNATDNTVTGLRAGWVAASGNMTASRGYIARGNSTVEFNGAPHNGNFDIQVSKNATTGVGWNLIGNPYPSGLDATKFLTLNGPAGNNIVENALYFWDDDASGGNNWSTQDYAVWNGVGTVGGPNSLTQFEGHIGSGQGFFVEKITAGNANVTFTNDMRSTMNNVFFKQAPIERLWLSAVSPQGDYNETLIAFLTDATDAADALYDARKLKGNDKIALYTNIQNVPYAIQAVGLIDENDKSISLGIDAGISGNYTIRLKLMENLDETVTVYLEDTYTNHIQNLMTNPVYTFHTAIGEHPTRFVLRFTAPFSYESTDATCQNHDGSILFEQPGSKIWNAMLSMHDGLMVERQTAFNGTLELSGLAQGLYELALTDDEGYRVTKLILVKGKEPVTSAFELTSHEVLTGETIQFNHQAQGAHSYDWNFGDGIFSSEEFPSHQYTTPGDYTVSLTAFNDDCSATHLSSVSVKAVTQDAVGIETMENASVKIHSYGKNVFVTFSQPGAQATQIHIYDIVGALVYSKYIPTDISTHTIRLEHLAEQIYVVKVTSANENVVKRVLIH